MAIELGRRIPLRGANARVNFFDENGKLTVIESGRDFKILAVNRLDDGFMASPAISAGALFLRSAQPFLSD